MDLSSLQRLVRRFLDRESDYASFRAEFVRVFLSIRHREVGVEDSVNLIESICADFDESDINDEDLRAELSIVASSPVISIEFVGEAGINKIHLPLSRGSSIPIPRPASGSTAISDFQQVV